MKNILRISLTFALSMIILGSCADIDKLSNDNSIAKFTILSYSPSTIEISSIEMDDNTIYIPILYGKYDFPLRFYAKLQINESINKIVGIDLSQEQCLESIDDVIKFHVMAKSGLTRTYYIKAREIPQDENNYLSRQIKVNEVTPRQIVAPLGVISTSGDTLSIFTVGGNFPVSVTPEFTIAPTSSIRNFTNGQTSLTFANERSVHKIKVVSKSGAERVWNIKVVNAEVKSGNDPQGNEELLEGTNINPRTLVATANSTTQVTSYVDNKAEKITLELKNSASASNENVEFPLSVNVKFESYEDIQLFDITNDTTLTFASYDDVRDFYMLDTESHVSRHWQIGLSKWTNSKANVTEFSYDYTASTVIYEYWVSPSKQKKGPAITLDKSQVEIYPESSEITLSMTAVNNVDIKTILNPDNWKLELKNVNVTLSPGATTALPNFVWEKNDSWKGYKEFTVTAENGTKKTWKIVIKDTRNYVKSNKCDLNEFVIESYAPNYLKLDPFNPILKDDQTKTITIKLSDDDGCYPLSIYPQYSLSQYATITPVASQPLVFQQATSENKITVMAEDGITSQTWNVKLQAPSREAKADITGFKITSLDPTTFTVGQIHKDDQAGVISIEMSKVGKLPLKLGYSMTISPKASSSLNLRGTFNFNSYSDVMRSTVTAEDGTSREWVIKIVFTPQLTNWNLDNWSGYSAVGWANANNDFITNPSTSPTTGVSGSAANLWSQVATVIVVKQFAAGSLFTGWFDKANAASLGLSDPVKLTHFGIPFESSAKLLGVEADVWYQSGSDKYNGYPYDQDYGSAVTFLINHDPTKGEFEFHGDRPGAGPHPDNTAVAVAKGYAIFGSKAATVEGNVVNVVPSGQWKRVFIPIVYPAGDMPKYTHFSVCFSSSWKGDTFKGGINSVMKVDNVKLIYEQ